ncbi:MAG: agmatinase [Euryarchaeota archaeon]|nr:agmatinase [Euryarchaeota archaeon]
MFQTSLFADASACLAEADFILVGAPFDATASFRAGTREGPDAIRQASYNFETYEDRYDVDLHDLKIFDLGNLVLGSDPAYAWETIGESFAFIPAEATPIFLGGEHSIAPPVVAEVARRHELGVIVLDAHLDLRDEYGGTKMSHACTSRRILDICDRHASIGIRSGSREEFLYAKMRGLHYHSSEEVAERGIDPVLEDALAEVGCDRIYLSIDFDCLDPAFAPAVGNPEPFGMVPRDVRRAIEVLAPIAAGLDVCEIAPQYDHGQTAILGARLVREFIAAKAAGADRLPGSDNRS